MSLPSMGPLIAGRHQPRHLYISSGMDSTIYLAESAHAAAAPAAVYKLIQSQRQRKEPAFSDDEKIYHGHGRHHHQL